MIILEYFPHSLFLSHAVAYQWAQVMRDVQCWTPWSFPCRLSDTWGLIGHNCKGMTRKRCRFLCEILVSVFMYESLFLSLQGQNRRTAILKGYLQVYACSCVWIFMDIFCIFVAHSPRLLPKPKQYFSYHMISQTIPAQSQFLKALRCLMLNAWNVLSKIHCQNAIHSNGNPPILLRTQTCLPKRGNIIMIITLVFIWNAYIHILTTMTNLAAEHKSQ